MLNVLKDLLGDLYTDEIKEKVGDVKLIKLDEGKYIPVDKFNAKIEEVKQQKEQLDEYKKQLKDLEKKAKGNEDLEKTIKDLRADNEKKDADYQATIKAQTKDFAIQSAIKEAQGKNVKAIKALLDTDKITVDDKGITGLSDQLKAIKESDTYLFGEDKVVGGDDHTPKDKSSPKPETLEAELKTAEKDGDTLAVISLKRKISQLPPKEK
ncbi:phage scaffolding protein [candidate division WOR-3 bacterium]|nr:phage scaffolding protein [candidate division WOR-3 bacterium]